MNLIEASKLGETRQRPSASGRSTSRLSRENGDWKGKVIHVEHLGADTILYLETEVTGLLTVRLFGEHKYDVDDVVYATPDKASIHRFGATGFCADFET
jgi:multiple sugar transport system ATP-binding protein